MCQNSVTPDNKVAVGRVDSRLSVYLSTGYGPLLKLRNQLDQDNAPRNEASEHASGVELPSVKPPATR